MKNFDKYLVENTTHLNGMIKKYRFENNYGASVICNDFSYGHEEGLFELAIIKFNEDNTWFICYDDNPIEPDCIIGYLTWEEVIEYLEKIQKIDKRWRYLNDK